MNDTTPLACSLGPEALRDRLDRIASLGARSLIGHAGEGGKHVLRFGYDEQTRRVLEQIVAAEARCCPFLALDLGEGDGELILTIAAPAEGGSVAAELAAAFGWR